MARLRRTARAAMVAAMQGGGQRPGTRDSDAAQAFACLAAVCADVASGTPVAGGSATVPADPSAPPDPRAMIELPDPRAMIDLVDRHRVTTLAIAALAQRMQARDPVVAARLAARARRRRLRALHRAERIATVSHALSAAGIRHLCVKGPVLSQQIHGDLAARDSKDIDLLVDPARIADVAAVLDPLGFADTGDHDAAERFANKHRSFVGGGIEIEVHTRLIDVDALLPLGFDAVWQRHERVTIGRVAVAALSRVDTLLYLCAHGASHLWFRLKWLEDIARIVATGDPATVAAARAVAREAGAEAIVVGALHLVEDIFGIVAGADAPIRPTRASRAMVRLSHRSLASPADYASAPPIRWILRKLPVQFGIGTRWRYRVRLAQTLLLAPRDFDVRALPRGLGWLRLPLRPAMLVLHRLGRS